MILPINEKRKFFSGKLKNNIKYSIIQDTNITQSSVCVCIKAGSINNPKEYQGLAHFLEHMLFLGSKKYKKENYFDDTLKCHGGSSNAYTALYETVYYFTVNHNYLEKILDIFSRFFIDPLFDQDSVSREINAIHSEHMKNYNNDMWRLDHFVSTLSNKDSIINKFNTGNLDTLNKPDIREKMIEFYNNYYCSDNITVALITPDDVNIVNNIFIKIFNQIPNKKAIKNEIIKVSPLFSNKGKEYQIIPILDTINIYYLWETDFLDKYNYNKIFNVIKFAVENMGKENLQQILYDKNLINSLQCYIQEEGVFTLIINISKSQVDNITDVIAKINSYVKYYFNNLSKMNWNSIYDYAEKQHLILFEHSKITDETELIDDMANNMHDYDEKNYYAGDKIIQKKEYDKLKEEIKNLAFENCFIIYSLQEKIENGNEMIEPIYNSSYYLISKSLIKGEMEFKFNIDIYSKYIDITPKIIKNLDKYLIPSLKNNRIWYGAVSKTNESFLIGNIIMSNKFLFNNVENYILTLISLNFINHKISKHFYKELNLGYFTFYTFNSIPSTINLLIGGFNDKYNDYFNDFHKFIKVLSDQLNNEDNINIIKMNVNKYKENLLNINKSSPWEYSNIMIDETVNNNNYSYLKKINLLETIDMSILIKKLQERIKEILLFNNFGVTLLFYGNYKFKDIPSLDMYNKNFNLPTIPLKKTNPVKSITIKNPNNQETNNLYMVLFNSGIFCPFNNTILLMIQLLMEQPSYDFLRTKKQLGYLVSSGIVKKYPYYYLNIKIQSEKNIKVIEENVNQFIKKFISILQDLDLEKIKTTTKEMLEEKLNSIEELNSRYKTEINNLTFMFNREKILISQLNKISKNDIIQYFNNILNNKSIIVINN